MTAGEPEAAGDETAGPASIHDAQPPEPCAGLPVLPFPVVAIGASAGGVEALMRFFALMPADSGCAFVVVMHLAPERESLLATLLSRATSMHVEQVVDGMRVRPNAVHVAPPGQHLELSHGRLRLVAAPDRMARPGAIDHFMVSLAGHQRDLAIGMVLTGTDSDGTLGIKAIKSEGGFVIAQAPSQAPHPGMPLAALATGQVDRQLPIEDMPQAILDFAAVPRLPPLQQEVPDDPQARLQQELLPQILETVRAQLGLDFRGYKTPMLLRRVRRRMALARMNAMADYLAHLASTPSETKALSEEFLISVTEFFREPESWDALAQEIIPQIVDAKEFGSAVRIWVPACATGEEAYSIAMLFLEHSRLVDRALKLQVFATDVDRNALDWARKGRYPRTIEHSVSPARLERFFLSTGHSYQVRKELREAVMFAPQNLISDPPFSHMDVVSCRNLLIYMVPELQRRLLDVFHFALDPSGFLSLGKSETASSLPTMFALATQRARIYRRMGPPRPAAIKLPPVPGMRVEYAPRVPIPAQLEPDYGRLVRESLIDQHITAAVLINREGRALYFYGAVHGYVQQPEGAPITDLFAMLRDDLRPLLRAAVHKAHSSRERAEAVGSMHAGDDGPEQPVRMVVTPLAARGDADLLLVTFERLEREPVAVPDHGDGVALRALENELRNTRRELRAAIEELESTNEELTTVNNQLQEKVSELEGVNDDLGNLLTSTHIPTLFLDRHLNIKRYTPAATRLFRLIPGDVNRPLSDIASQIDLASLFADARKVLEQLAPVEQETRLAGGEHYLRRILPYRTQDDRIDGVVVTFIDITEIRRAAEGQRRFAAVMQASPDAIVMHDLAGRVLAFNRGAEALYGHAEADVLNADFASLLPPEVREQHAQCVQRLLAGERMVGVDTRRRHRDGTVLDVSASYTVVGDGGQPSAVALIERDVTRHKRAEHELRESEQRFRMLADSAPVLIWMSRMDGTIEFANREFAAYTGLAGESLVGRRWSDLLHREDVEAVATKLDGALRGNAGRVITTAQLRNGTGEYRWMKLSAMPRFDAHGQPVGIVGSMADIDAQIGAERALRAADQRKDEFLAMLGHELRNPLVPIRNAAEVLNRVSGDDGRLHWVRDTLVRQVEHVTRLVDDLLNISLVTRGAMRLQLEPVDLRHAIERAVDGAMPLIKRKRHRFDADWPDEPLWVEGDSIRLTQVVDNLLTNAAKYTDDGGRLQLELRREGDRAVVAVRDNGLGISPGMRGRIFDLFVQDERSVDRSQGGLGIGLALVRHLVELHHGTVEARSEGIGKGCEFIVRLPLLPAAAVPAPLAQGLHESGSGGRILIVDDDPDSVDSTAMLLRLDGYDVASAGDLDTAVQAARALRPQVVLMDLALPHTDGYEVMRRLRSLPEVPRDAKYLAISGFGRPEDFQRTSQAGFERLLVKPVDPEELSRLLGEFLSAV